MRPLSALILGVAFVLGATFFGEFFVRARTDDNVIRVVGWASQQFESDIVKWRITIGRTTAVNEARAGYASLRRDRNLLVAFLTSNGIQSSEISIQPVNRNTIYDEQGRPSGYSFTQTFDVVSPRIDTVERLALNPDVLYEQGVAVQSSNLEYYLSRLTELKRELLAEATRDARARAEEIARSTGARVGRLGGARAGVFQITEPYSTEVSDYGIYSTTTRKKNVTITVSATFGID